MQRAYTSTVVSPVHLAVGVGLAVGFGVLTVMNGVPIWVSAVATVAMLIAAVHLSTVRLAIGAGRIVIGHGPWGGPGRTVPCEAVASATEERLRWPQVFGVGVRFHHRSERLTVRPGPTLHLELVTGEHLRISTRRPTDARALLSSLSEVEEESMGNKPTRPWFGPKRVGYGFRPQTWQGWAIVAAVAVAIIVIALAERH
jgi:hypothetical protein